MDKTNTKIIKPIIPKPVFVDKQLLYPQFLGEISISVPRAIGRPRKFRIVLLVDGCTGKVSRCDSWPYLESVDEFYETIDTRIELKDAEASMINYANKKIARRHMTYWKTDINILRFHTVYKVFWVTDSENIVDSISSNELKIS